MEDLDVVVHLDGLCKPAVGGADESGAPSLEESFLCALGEAWVLYYPLTDRLLVLNATAKTVCDLLNQGYQVPEIKRVFVRAFGISDERAARDVEQVLADLTHGDPAGERDPGQAGGWGDGSYVPAARRDSPADCGGFRFGQNRIRVFSSATELDESFFLRFQHRAVNNGTEVLEISGDGCAYRLTFCGKVVAEAKTIRQTASRLVDFLLSLEHPERPLLAACHAAAVSREGRSVLIPGGSGIGKSTLTAFLVANGFAYLADDTIAIGDQGTALLPLPTCLSIKAGSWPLLEPLYPVLQRLATLHRYGRSIRYLEPRGNYELLQAAAAPSAIVFPAYSAGEATRLTRVPPVQTMINLLGAHARLSSPGSGAKLAELVRFVERTPAYRLSYGELTGAMNALDGLLAADVVARKAT